MIQNGENEPRFTLAELKEVLQEKNILKGKVMELEEEMSHIKRVHGISSQRSVFSFPLSISLVSLFLSYIFFDIFFSINMSLSFSVSLFNFSSHFPFFISFCSHLLILRMFIFQPRWKSKEIFTIRCQRRRSTRTGKYYDLSR